MSDKAEIIDLTYFPKDTYVSMVEMGNCKVCGHYEDLRYGACFDCSEKVSGQKTEGGHELWETKNPQNRWKVIAQ